MGKGTDKLYITHSEWASSDAFSASKGAAERSGLATLPNGGASFRRLPFNYCAASLQPFVHPVCTPDGTIFDADVIATWLRNHADDPTNPVTGAPLAKTDLIRLVFARNDADGSGDLIDPVTFKVFTDNTHIVALRHGDYANVFAYDTVERMNIKTKTWRDLVDDQPFSRQDMITLQDPQNTDARDLSQFKFVKEGKAAALSKAQETARASESSVNLGALGSIGKVLAKKGKEAEKEEAEKEETKKGVKDIKNTKDVKDVKKREDNKAVATTKPKPKTTKPLAYNAATYTTGAAAASFTSTGLTPETSGARAVLTDEEWMLRPRRVKITGYARIETSVGDVNVELYTDTAPKAVWNFVKLAQQGYYRNVRFHRNIRRFMIQGGDPTGTGRGGQSVWGKNFADEFDGPHVHDGRGVLSMANKGKNTNGSQFFLTYRAAPHLDRKHTIFGRVAVDSLPVLDLMEGAANRDGKGGSDPEVVIRDVVVYLDPFAEFLKQKAEKDAEAEEKAEIQRQGGTEDDKITWTGKRIRGKDDNDRSSSSDATGGSVGKYLQAALQKQKQPQPQKHKKVNAEEEAWQEPVRKKTKSGGFGNFDGW